jgi:sterol desaturase/sphingolipid hydroxylase (fatty acid hydroxylase superfamily)
MLSTISYIISYDIWFYLSHIILHNKTFYVFHKQHHVHIHPIWLDTLEGSTFESVFQIFGLFLPLLYYQTIGVHFLTAASLIGIRALMRHDPRCSFLIGNHHLLHHKYPSYNFGQYWIDAVCGTLYPNATEHEWGLLFFL